MLCVNGQAGGDAPPDGCSAALTFVDLAGSERLPSTLSDDREQEKLRQKEVRPPFGTSSRGSGPRP